MSPGETRAQKPYAPPPMPEGMVLNPATGQVEDMRSPVNPHIPSLGTPGITAAALGVGQGVGFGTLDETVAGISSIGGPAGTYDYNLARMREAERRAAENSPGSYYTGLVGGGLVGAAGIAKAAAPALKGAANGSGVLGVLGGGARYAAGLGPEGMSKAPGLATRMIAGAGAGAIDAGAYGYGAGEGGAASRTEDAANNALIGALVGGALPLGAAGAKAAARGVYNVAAAPFAKGVRPDAAGEVLTKAMQRAGMSPEDLSAAMQNARAEGQKGYAVADALGNPGQRALNGAVRLGGAPQDYAHGFLARRQAGQGDRLSAYLQDALGAPDTAAQRAATLTDARNSAADAAYAAARKDAGPVDVRDAVALIDGRIGGIQGSGVTGDGIDATLSTFRNRLAARDPAASVIPGETGVAPAGMKTAKTAVELSDFDRVLGVKQDVQDAIGAARRAGHDNKARVLQQLANALDSALANSSPSYRTANDQFAKASAAIRAVDTGKAAGGRTRASDTLDIIRALQPDQLAPFRAGYADPLISRMENASVGTNKAIPLQSDKNAAILDALARDPALLRRQIDRESTMARTNQLTMGGSSTVDNATDIGGAIGGAARAVGGSIAFPHSTGPRALGLLFSAIGNGAKGVNEATREDIAKALLSNDVSGRLADFYARRNVRGAIGIAGAAATRSGINRLTGQPR